MMTWCVSKPLMAFFSPVFLMSTSTSICFSFGLDGARGLTAFLLPRVLFRLLLRFFHPAAQLGEGRHLVALLLQVEVVDLLLGQVDDLAGLLVHRRLAVAFDGDRRHDAFFRGLAAEEIHHASEHAAELDARFLIGAHVGAERVGGEDEQGRRQARRRSGFVS